MERDRKKVRMVTGGTGEKRLSMLKCFFFSKRKNSGCWEDTEKLRHAGGNVN